MIMHVGGITEHGINTDINILHGKRLPEKGFAGFMRLFMNQI